MCEAVDEVVDVVSFVVEDCVSVVVRKRSEKEMREEENGMRCESRE